MKVLHALRCGLWWIWPCGTSQVLARFDSTTTGRHLCLAYSARPLGKLEHSRVMMLATLQVTPLKLIDPLLPERDLLVLLRTYTFDKQAVLSSPMARHDSQSYCASVKVSMSLYTQ